MTQWNSDVYRRAGPAFALTQEAAIAAIRCDREADTIEIQLMDVPDFDQAESECNVTIRLSTEEMLKLVKVAISKDGRLGNLDTLG